MTLQTKNNEQQKGLVQSVQRAMSLLNHVVGHPDGIGHRDLARISGLKVPTVHALIKTLLSMNYLEQSSRDRKYRLGMGSLILGFGVPAHWAQRLSEGVRPQLENLSKCCDESAVLFAFHNGVIVCLETINRRLATTVSIDPGYFISSPHTTAGGLVLLSHASHDFQTDYAYLHHQRKLLGEQYKNVEDMLQHFTEIKKCSLAEVNNLFGLGLYGLAMPVKGYSGRCDIAVGLNIFSSKINEKKRTFMIESMRNTVKDMEDWFAQYNRDYRFLTQ